MRERKLVSLSVVLATLIYVSYGCQIVDHPIWEMTILTNILDTYPVGDIVISRGTIDIEDIIDVRYGAAIRGGPYFDLSMENSQLVVRTNSAFARYEENEIASRVPITVDFRCTGGGTRLGLLLWIDITDTNNNEPQFMSNTNEFEFVITPPLPPGFLITGCYNEVITVRDIDLTTYAINFTIADNPYFEIEFDEAASTAEKEFIAQIRTKTFVRSLNEVLTLSITATDVDRTEGPPLTVNSTVRIVTDTEFQFPEEPVFYEAFYLANYTDDHQLNLLETISLRQGFDEYVNFTLEGEYSEHFDLRVVGSEVSLVVQDLNPLPSEVWLNRQIYLIVNAVREFTSGASTTVIVQLPEEIKLQFGRAFYEGLIKNNTLDLAPLVLSQGYEGVMVAAHVIGEHASYFTATVETNLVRLAMSPLIHDIIDNNNFILLEVVASSGFSSATAVVNLEIIKEDINTPVFNQNIYSGRYDSATGLSIEEIRFEQGFDDTVTVVLTGDNAEYFKITEIGEVLTITASTIPPEMFRLQNILITIEASKPRTVGANAALHIALPAARELEFDESTYRGFIDGGLLTLPTILLQQGYEDGLNFTLSGEHFTYFRVTNDREQVSIGLPNPLPNYVTEQNSFILLTLTASGLNAITTTTSILLEIIKEDTTTPVFGQSIYYGTYTAGTVEIEPINLIQGFDSSVSFCIDGEHARYFMVHENATISLQYPIPEDVIFNEKVLIFNILADKALTVGANAAVLIRFPTDLTESAIMRFSQNTYIGTLEGNEFHLDEIVLDTGFATGTEFIISGDYAEHFSWSNINNIVQISSLDTIPSQVLEERDFILLELEARRDRAISAWTSIIVDIIKKEIIVPVFSQAYYRGSYTEDTRLTFEETISLSEGYDETVTFELNGVPETWFSLEQEGNSLTLVSNAPVPPEVLESNNQLLFTIIAKKPNVSGRAVISLDLPKDFSDNSFRFQQNFYNGFLEDEDLRLSEIILEGYTNDVNYIFTGDYVDYFQLTNENGRFIIEVESSLPEVLNGTRLFVLTLEAHNMNIRTHTVIIIERVTKTIDRQYIEFEKPYYIGNYSTTDSLQFDAEIRLTTETNQSIVFHLEGDDATWFGLVQSGNSVKVTLISPIPAGVIGNNQQLVFVVTARAPGSATARATVIISLVDYSPEAIVLGFDHVSYLGTIENNQTNIPPVTLRDGFSEAVEFTLHGGGLENYFSLDQEGAIVRITLQREIPEELIPVNRIIVLQLQASAPETITAYATIVIEYIVNEENRPIVELIFNHTFYDGSYAVATGLTFPTPISLTQGYDSNVVFGLEGDDAIWFDLVASGNSVRVTLVSPIPGGVIENNQQLVFVVTARTPGSATARATVIISLVDYSPEAIVLGFDHVSYLGTIENNQTNIPPVTLRDGFSEAVEFTLHGGGLENYFRLDQEGAIVRITLQTEIPEELIPVNRIIVLQLQASAPETVTAYATIVIEYIINEESRPIVELIFAQTFYNGSYTAATGLTFPTPILLTQGYDSTVEFGLEGDDAVWFQLVPNANSVIVMLIRPIPVTVIENNTQLVFVVTAKSPSSATARTVVIIYLRDDSQSGLDVTFEKVLYEGFVQDGVVHHEIITVIGFSGSTVELHGEFSTLFNATLANDRVIVSALGALTLPNEINYVILELHAGTAATVLVLNVIQTDGPPTPTVTFTSPSYAIRVDVSHTGLVGQVEASADNGEAVTYSLQSDIDHLQERLSINNVGELRLSAPLNSGFYTFDVVATTVFTQTSGNAVIHLSVEAVTVCGDELVMPPLIVLDVDEEEPHRDLINGTRYDDCHFTLTNRWPLNQAWVYVDQEGLHTRAIDREHESIAFMALSQVQVEVILHCERDSTRIKRSVLSDPLGPYDYGSNKWILTDTILYNSRRSIVNIIVNDINDNAPIFVGKETEPIAVGYPIPELVERVLPRALAELQATDADIGENAALIYWSSAPELAVSPFTGFVHLRTGATLENGTRLTINATDRRGEGLTGSIDITVRLLDKSHIAVVTVRDAFLDDEDTIVSALSEAVGYEVKILRSVVISHETETEQSLPMRELTNATSALLQLYAYGLIAREPVSVDQLTADISNIVTGSVIIASSVSLLDHLEGQEICVIAGRDTGLLVATIVLSVLLFIVLVLIAVWFFLRWRKNRNYDEFSDDNSLASRNGSVDKFSKPEVLPKLRLDIAELKKSERRLQERLDAPVQEISVEPTSSINDAILDMPEASSSKNDANFKMLEPMTPIVIQSIDKLKDASDDSSDDEFGEVKTPRRKSVVTFNENVEKIIHVEDTPDSEIIDEPMYEVYKL